VCHGVWWHSLTFLGEPHRGRRSAAAKRRPYRGPPLAPGRQYNDALPLFVVTEGGLNAELFVTLQRKMMRQGVARAPRRRGEKLRDKIEAQLGAINLSRVKHASSADSQQPRTPGDGIAA
jgi:hypothetical protein